MSARRPTVSNPADLLLRISRTPAGLHITSPQLPAWAVVARGPVPIAQALNTAWQLLASVDDAGHNELEKWDAAAASLAASGACLTADDVIVVRTDRARRLSGAPITRHGVNGPRHDPFAWVDMGNGFWQSPSGHRYPERTQQVQRVIAARARTAGAPPPAGVQQTFDDVAS